MSNMTPLRGFLLYDITLIAIFVISVNQNHIESTFFSIYSFLFDFELIYINVLVKSSTVDLFWFLGKSDTIMIFFRCLGHLLKGLYGKVFTLMYLEILCDSLSLIGNIYSLVINNFSLEQFS